MDPVAFVQSQLCDDNPTPPEQPTTPPEQPTTPPQQPPAQSLTIISASPQGAAYAPGQEFHPDVVVQTNGFSLDCSQNFLENRDGNLYGTGPTQGCQDIGNNRYRIYFNAPMKAPGGAGTYRSRWQIWQWPNHLSPAVDLWFDVGDSSGTTPNNRAPDRPSLRSPGDWAVTRTEQAPELCWNNANDPDGDSVQYYAEIFESATNDNSGWTGSTCWRPGKLTGRYSGYQWRVKARDSSGKESGWSDVWHFTMNPPPVPAPTLDPTLPPQPPTPTPVVGTWWDTNYAYRRPINLTGSKHAGEIFQVGEFDLSTLVAEGKARSDYNDVRVVKKLSDTSWQEVSRRIYTPTDLEFQLDADVNMDATPFYLYYGNPSASAPTPMADPPQGWWMEYYNDLYWESFVTRVEFNRTIDTEDTCNPERDGGFEHRDRTGDCFDDSDKFLGRVFVPQSGDWTFYLYTNAGYEVTVHGNQIGKKDRNDMHGTSEEQMRTIYLKAGWHQLDLRSTWVNSGPWKFMMEGPGFSKQIIPANYYQRVFGNFGWGIGVHAEEILNPPTPTPTNTPVPTDTPTPIPAPTDTPIPPPTATMPPFPTMTPTMTPTEGPAPAPTPIPPILKIQAGASTMSLQWEPSNDPRVTEYRVLRTLVEGQPPEPVALVDAPSYIDTTTAQTSTLSLSNVERGDGGCYQVEALRENGIVVATSNLACDTFGTIALWVPEVWAKPGDTVLVPINIRNASGLQIASSEIRLGYDSTAGIVPTRVLASSMIAGQYELASDLETPDLVRVALYATDQPPLYGEGTLVWVEFQVNGEEGNETRLELQAVTGDLGGADPGGTVIYTANDLAVPAPLALTSGRLRVGVSHNLGDVDGTGTLQVEDGTLALQIATTQHAATWQQQHAGDVNGDGHVGAADAAMIFYRSIHDAWPIGGDTVTTTHQLAAEDNPTVSIPMTSTHLTPGDVITTVLKATNLPGVAAGEFTIGYDPLVVQEISALPGVGTESHDDGNGQLSVAVASNQSSSGDGVLAFLLLRIAPDAPEGESVLAVLDARLYDLAGRDITTSAQQQEITRVGGTFEVGEEGEILYLPLVRR